MSDNLYDFQSGSVEPIDLNEQAYQEGVPSDEVEGERWENYVEFIEANTEQYPDFVQQFYVDTRVPKYAVQALLPRLNELGEDGWELVHLQPVKVSFEGNILLQEHNQALYTNTYLCAFKRRIN